MGEDAIVLECADVGFRYPEDSASAPGAALSRLNLRVRRGEMVAVLGPGGSGTSTLCRLAAGLLADRGSISGVVRRGGRGDDERVEAGRCAMLGDDPEAQLTGMTTYVDDEVRLPRRLHGFPGGRSPVEALAVLGVERLSGRRLDTLSGGERQLVALAALITLEPTLLVLDQPSLSLDPGSRGLLATALRRFCDDGGAVLLAGHQHDELSEAADRIALLWEGSIARTLPRGSAAAADLESHGVWTTVPCGADSSIDRERAGRRPEEAGSAPLLTANGLSIARGGRSLFEDVDLRVEGGRVLAVVGANGVGKSTLLQGLAGLLDADASLGGEIWAGHGADRVPLHAIPAHLRARHAAWVGQDPSAQLSAPSVRAELERSVPLPAHRRRDRARVRAERARDAEQLLGSMGLSGNAETHPSDLGQAQRKDLVIASARLLRAPVLLLDEPTLGRDLAGMRRLERVVGEFTAAGGAVIVTTHDLRWARAVSHTILALRG